VTVGTNASIAAAIDEDDDGLIEDAEILAAIDYWQTDEPVPETGGRLISDSTMLELIDLWQTGERIDAAA